MSRRGGGYGTAQLRTGRTTDVTLTTRDTTRLREIARWYCLAPDHLYRRENGLLLAAQHATRNGGTQAAYTGNIRNRMARLAAIRETTQAVGPLVAINEIDARRIGYNTTRYGATAAEVPWELSPHINVLSARHAWTAADVGHHIESYGYTTVSEREIATGIDITGNQLPTELGSPLTDAKGTTITKRPDIAVLAPDHTTHIAIEIERVTNRRLSIYRDKLTAYATNPAVTAVWYLTDNPTTTNRVTRAAIEAFGPDWATNPHLNIRITQLKDAGGFYLLPGINLSFQYLDGETGIGQHLLADLTRVQGPPTLLGGPPTLTTTNPQPPTDTTPTTHHTEGGWA